MYEIKDILERLGRGEAVKAKKEMAKVKVGLVKITDGKSFLTKEQIQRNLRRRMDRDELIRSRQSSGTKYAGGEVQTSVYGDFGRQTGRNAMPTGRASDITGVPQAGFARGGKATGFAKNF